MHIISWQRSRQLGKSVLGVTSATHDPSMTTGNQGKHPTSLSLLYPLHPLHTFSQPPIHININILILPNHHTTTKKNKTATMNAGTGQQGNAAGGQEDYLDKGTFSPLPLSPHPTLNPSHLPTSSLTLLLNLPCLHTYLPSLPPAHPVFPLPLLDLDLDLHLILQS